MTSALCCNIGQIGLLGQVFFENIVVFTAAGFVIGSLGAIIVAPYTISAADIEKRAALAVGVSCVALVSLFGSMAFFLVGLQYVQI